MGERYKTMGQTETLIANIPTIARQDVLFGGKVKRPDHELRIKKELDLKLRNFASSVKAVDERLTTAFPATHADFTVARLDIEAAQKQLIEDVKNYYKELKAEQQTLSSQHGETRTTKDLEFLAVTRERFEMILPEHGKRLAELEKASDAQYQGDNQIPFGKLANDFTEQLHAVINENAPLQLIDNNERGGLTDEFVRANPEIYDRVAMKDRVDDLDQLTSTLIKDARAVSHNDQAALYPLMDSAHMWMSESKKDQLTEELVKEMTAYFKIAANADHSYKARAKSYMRLENQLATILPQLKDSKKEIVAELAKQGITTRSIEDLKQNILAAKAN